MATIEVVFFGVLVLAALTDIKTMKVSIWTLAAVSALILLQGNVKWVSILEGFLLMLSSMFICDGILGRETLGGGDLWLGTAMSGFMGFHWFLISYVIAAFLGFCWMNRPDRRYWELDVAYVPFLAIGTVISRLL